MTMPGFALCAMLYTMLVVAAVAVGAFEPWAAVLAWSVMILVDASLRAIIWALGRNGD